MESIEANLKQVILVSSPFVNGIGILANLFLSLGYKVENVSLQPWIRDVATNKFYLEDNTMKILSYHLPYLNKKNQFTFHNSIEFKWDHRLDFKMENLKLVIFVQRDIRDSIYSLYSRDIKHQNITFDEYLEIYHEYPDHFPGLFFVPPPETAVMFLLHWKIIAKKKIKYVSFYDLKLDLYNKVIEIITLLKLNIKEKDLKDSVDGSNIKFFEKSMVDSNKIFNMSRKTTQGGIINNWKNHFSEAQIKRFEKSVYLVNLIFKNGKLITLIKLWLINIIWNKKSFFEILQNKNNIKEKFKIIILHYLKCNNSIKLSYSNKILIFLALIWLFGRELEKISTISNKIMDYKLK